MTLRVGLAGCGWISAFQLQGWGLIPEAEVVGVCDRDPSRARDVASRFGIAWAGDDAIRMMRECGLDILDIATPPESHKDLALAAFERGLHVLCQKPAATTLEDTRTMIRRADECRTTLYINEMLRFCPWFCRTHALLRSGAIGRPVFARLFSRAAGFLQVGPDRKVLYGFRDFLKTSARGIMLEQTIHYLDVMRYLFGEPKSIYAAAERVSPMLCGEDVATILLRYEGMTAVIEDSWSAHGPERSGLEIEGTGGALLLSHAKVLELHSGQRGALEERWDFSDRSWDERRPPVFASLFADFLRVIGSRGDRTAQARDNLNTLRLTLAAYESAETGRHVRL